MSVPVDLRRSVGYQLKRLTTALHGEMEAGLRPHGLGVTQYACLELLDQHPGLSNAELARGAFVSRQAMNVVLRGLQDAGLVHRPDTADHGRARPTTLTAEGRARLTAGRDAVLAVESRMLTGIDAARAEGLLSDLGVMAEALGRQAPVRSGG